LLDSEDEEDGVVEDEEGAKPVKVGENLGVECVGVGWKVMEGCSTAGRLLLVPEPALVPRPEGWSAMMIGRVESMMVWRVLWWRMLADSCPPCRVVEGQASSAMVSAQALDEKTAACSGSGPSLLHVAKMIEFILNSFS
jgi:hypothetical protein